MSEFKTKVLYIIKLVPKGRVVSYGQVALLAGLPRGARMIGWLLHSLYTSKGPIREEIPWWRVVNNAGRISIKGCEANASLIQKQHLESEGIEFYPDSLSFDMARYRYLPDLSVLKKLNLDDSHIDQIIRKYPWESIH